MSTGECINLLFLMKYNYGDIYKELVKYNYGDIYKELVKYNYADIYRARMEKIHATS